MNKSLFISTAHIQNQPSGAFSKKVLDLSSDYSEEPEKKFNQVSALLTCKDPPKIKIYTCITAIF